MMTSIATTNTTNRIDESPLPQGWVWTTLGDVATLVGGGTPSRRKPEYFGGDIVWLTPTEIPKDRVSTIHDSKERITNLGLQKSSARIVPRGSVLMTSRASIGYVAVAGTEVSTNQGFANFIPEKGVHNAYLAYWLWANADQFEHLATGTTFKEIGKAKLRPIPIPLAPLSEQHRIVAEIETQLTRLHAGIAALKQVQANLRRYKAAVLKAACEGRLAPTEAELTAVGADGVRPPYEPASALLERILTERRAKWEETQWVKEVDRAKQKAAKAARMAAGRPLRRGERLSPQEWQDTPEAEYGKYLPKDDKWKAKYKEAAAPDTQGLPELPEGWVWATVEQLAAHEPNSITDGPFGSKLKTVHYREDGPRVIRLQNVGDGEFHDEEAHIGWEHFETLRKHEVFAGDLVIAALGASLPRSCVIPGHVGPAIVKADCIRFKPCAAADVTFLNAALNSEPLKRYAANIVHGVGRPRLNQQEIKSLPIPLPPLVEQRRIGGEAERQRSVLKKLEVTVEANLKRAERLRRAILKRAFEGKLVPQDSGDEPASVLLERIRATRDEGNRATKPSRVARGRKRPEQLPLL